MKEVNPTLYALQFHMKDQGHYTGVLDGIWGPMSQAALQATIKTKKSAKALQEILSDSGFYIGDIDGAWGRLSENALKRATGELVRPSKIAWAKKLDDKCLNRVIAICDALDMSRSDGPTDLMSCMAWESGETFSPSILNGAGSGAVGLIQFMPSTAKGLGTTTAALAKLSVFDQLQYVYKYFRPYKGKLHNLSSLYMAILYPVACGKPDSHVLFKNGTTVYRQNAGLDVNKDGDITVGEAAQKVYEKKLRGLTTTYAR